MKLAELAIANLTGIYSPESSLFIFQIAQGQKVCELLRNGRGYVYVGQIRVRVPRLIIGLFVLAFVKIDGVEWWRRRPV